MSNYKKCGAVDTQALQISILRRAVGQRNGDSRRVFCYAQRRRSAVSGSESAAPLGWPVFSRHWAMPNGDTFSIPIIGNFVKRYIQQSEVSVDPFARNKRWATHTNDLNPETEAENHMDALDFLNMLADHGVSADLVIFDPPYSPNQLVEQYKSIDKQARGNHYTYHSRKVKQWKDAAARIMLPGAVVLTFGWNSNGFGKVRGFAIEEGFIVAHGGAHNDTICMAERRLPEEADLFTANNCLGEVSPKSAIKTGKTGNKEEEWKK